MIVKGERWSGKARGRDTETSVEGKRGGGGESNRI